MKKKLQTIYKYKNLIKVEKFYLEKKKIPDFHKIVLADGCMAIIKKKNKILIVKEYRAAFNSYTFGLPGGMLDKNETPKKCIEREIKEELGLDLKKIKKIYEYKRNGNYDCGNDHIFLCEPKKFSLKLEKNIFYSWKSTENIIRMIQKKDFKTPGVIAALLFYLIEYKYLKIRKI